MGKPSEGHVRSDEELAALQDDLALVESRLESVQRTREETEDRDRPGLAVAISHVKHRLAKWQYGRAKKKYELRWGKAGE